jgi:ER lumen protein retaining receptor
MNIFRLAGDMMHVISIFLLIVRLMATKNAVGISIKTQELYLIVFVCRYLDLFTSFYSVYNTVMKIMYITATAYVIYMVYRTEPFKTEYDKTQDSFLHWKFAVAPCAVFAVITIYFQGYDFMELMWNFSIYLEAICIVPQLIVLQRYQEVENLTANYVFFLGAYRLLYILNWVYRAYHEVYYKHNWIVYTCATIQTALYLDFFYYYIQSKYKGGKFSLPN